MSAAPRPALTLAALARCPSFATCPLPIAPYPLPFALCPLPFVLCPLPLAPCPLPHAPCPLPLLPSPCPGCPLPFLCLLPRYIESAHTFYPCRYPCPLSLLCHLLLDPCLLCLASFLFLAPCPVPVAPCHLPLCPIAHPPMLSSPHLQPLPPLPPLFPLPPLPSLVPLHPLAPLGSPASFTVPLSRSFLPLLITALCPCLSLVFFTPSGV
jgi:hypothetical protein